jgi:hypothetical protein
MAEDDQLSPDDLAAAKARRLEAMALQDIEGNPLTLADAQLFDMYEREAWSHQRRRADLLARAALS